MYTLSFLSSKWTFRTNCLSIHQTDFHQIFTIRYVFDRRLLIRSLKTDCNIALLTSDLQRFMCDDLAISYKNLVRFCPITLEFKRVVGVHQLIYKHTQNTPTHLKTSHLVAMRCDGLYHHWDIDERSSCWAPRDPRPRPNKFSDRWIIIYPIAIAYSMGQIIKSFCICPCVCVCVCVCVRLWTLSRSHFFVDFHQIGRRRVNPQK